MLLSIEHLTAGYGQIEILEDVSLSIAPGEMVALIGPNGAGKSTVLKSVAGLTTRTGGKVIWKDKDITGLPTHALLEEGIGYLPQGRLVFASLTVEENLDMGGYLINHRETLEKNREEVFTHFPVLRAKRHSRAGDLSGGQQQQLAIGRALMSSPTLLMLDEPSLGLSPKLTCEIFDELARIRAEGVALLVVEQNVRLVLSYADRGYLLVNGEVRLDGSAKALGVARVMHDAFLT